MNAAHKSKKLNDAKKDEKQRYRHIYYDRNPFHESQKLTDVEKKMHRIQQKYTLYDEHSS
jgi:hypothetical protein